MNKSIYVETTNNLQVTLEDLVSAVRNHANSHWGKKGWDIIAETYTQEEIAKELREKGCKTAKSAIRHFSYLAKLKKDYEKEIASTAW
jgi:hypothetical protein